MDKPVTENGIIFCTAWDIMADYYDEVMNNGTHKIKLVNGHAEYELADNTKSGTVRLERMDVLTGIGRVVRYVKADQRVELIPR